MEMFEIGGCVRDELLGLRSKDIDFSVVLSASELDDPNFTAFQRSPYDIMVANLEASGVRIIRNDEGKVIGSEHLTARGIDPKRGAVDFVLARKEGTYSDGRRPDSVEIGTLRDDIMRRDFTMNALAKSVDGNIIDMVGGVQDINDRVIRAVGSAFDRLTEDALRAVRALRFSVTKGFRIDPELAFAMETKAVTDAVRDNISDERIKDELSKMFQFHTVLAMRVMSYYPGLTAAVFSGTVSLDATMKTKGRNKQ